MDRPSVLVDEGLPSKRRRNDDDDGDEAVGAAALVVARRDGGDDGALRTSSLASPTMQLTGHAGSVYALSYSPNGSALLSASFDKTCLLWDAESGRYGNYNVLAGHKNAVLDCCFVSDDVAATCGADKTVQLWDTYTGKRLRRWQDHKSIVNSVAAVSSNTVASVGDDGNCCVFDVRQRRPAQVLEDEYPLLAVAATSSNVYTGGIDNLVHCWDLRGAIGGGPGGTGKKVYSLKGHTDTITSLAIHPQQTHILSNSMDCTLRSWDIRPFVESGKSAGGAKRHSKTFRGHTHNAERGLLKCCWSADDGKMVSCGSADKQVHIWDEYSEQELYTLPGHRGCVNAVTFHPTQTNVVASGSSDKHIFVGELS